MTARGSGGTRKLRLPEVSQASPRLADKLTDFEVIQILGALRCEVPVAVIGWEFQVCEKTIRNIARGKSHKHLPRPQIPSTGRSFGRYDLSLAVEMLKAGKSLERVSDELGVSRSNLARRIREARAEQGVGGEGTSAEGVAGESDCTERPVPGAREGDHRTLRQIQLQTEEIIEVFREIGDSSRGTNALGSGGNE